jgi:hypothetical protein
MTDFERVMLTAVLTLGLVGVFIWYARLVPRLSKMFLGPSDKRDLVAWEYKVEVLLQEHGRSCLRTASIECELFAEIGRMPRTFVHPVEKGIQLGHAVEQALRVRAEELGIYRAPESQVVAPVVPPLENVGAEVIALTQGGQFEWQGGKLVARRG